MINILNKINVLKKNTQWTLDEPISFENIYIILKKTKRFLNILPKYRIETKGRNTIILNYRKRKHKLQEITVIVNENNNTVTLNATLDNNRHYILIYFILLSCFIIFTGIHNMPLMILLVILFVVTLIHIFIFIRANKKTENWFNKETEYIKSILLDKNLHS